MDFKHSSKSEQISFNQCEMYLKVGLVNLHNSGSGLFL